MEVLIAILIPAAVVAIGAALFLLNRQAARLFRYMKENHHADWINIGLPTQMPGYYFHNKESAFVYLLDRAYEQSGDEIFVRMCSVFRRNYIGMGLLASAALIIFILFAFLGAN